MSGKSMCMLSCLNDFLYDKSNVVSTIDIGNSYESIIQNELKWLDVVFESTNMIASEQINFFKSFNNVYKDSDLSIFADFNKVSKEENIELDNYLLSFNNVNNNG